MGGGGPPVTSGRLANALGGGAVVAVTGLVLIVPVLVQVLPSSWQAIIERTKFTPAGHLLAPWTSFALFCACAAAPALPPR